VARFTVKRTDCGAVSQTGVKEEVEKISFGLRLKILRIVVDLHAIFGALRVKMFLFDTLVDVEEKFQDRRD
jgi:hypothetical protein